MKSSNTTTFIIAGVFLALSLTGCYLPRGLFDAPSMNAPARDATPSETGYFELGGSYNFFEFSDGHIISLLGEFPVSDRVSFGIELPYAGIEFDDFDDGESGIADIPFWLNVHLYENENTVIDAGGWAEIPIGAEEVGGGDFDYGFSVSGRYLLNDDFAGYANVGVDILDNCIEEIDERFTLIRGGAGLTYGFTDRFSVQAEFNVLEEEDERFRFRLGDFSHLKGGLGYRFSDQLAGRAVFGTGLRDFGPDTFFELKLRTSLGF